MSARYWELTLTVPPDAAEGVTNFLWESGALGVVEEERPGRPPELRAFFPETAPPAVLSERVSAYTAGLATLGFGATSRPRVIAYRTRPSERETLNRSCVSRYGAASAGLPRPP